jgi:hypothetical protein
MLVKQKIREEKIVEKNIELPYYSKNGVGHFYRINEDESVLRVIVDPDFCYQMDLFVKPKHAAAHLLEEAASANPCDAEKVEEAVRKYLEFVGSTVELLAESV